MLFRSIKAEQMFNIENLYDLDKSSVPTQIISQFIGPFPFQIFSLKKRLSCRRFALHGFDNPFVESEIIDSGNQGQS